MQALSKANIKHYGDDCVIKKVGRFTYAVIRESDGVVLVKGFKFRRYKNDIINVMYTGEAYGTGDIILKSDQHGVIYKFK